MKVNLKTSEGIISMLERALDEMNEDKLSIEFAGKRISACKHAIQQHALDLLTSKLKGRASQDVPLLQNA